MAIQALRFPSERIIIKSLTTHPRLTGLNEVDNKIIPKIAKIFANRKIDSNKIPLAVFYIFESLKEKRDPSYQLLKLVPSIDICLAKAIEDCSINKKSSLIISKL